MKTKAEIIQRLLDKKHIKVEEAMVLMEKEKEYIYQPYYPYHYWSVQPYINYPLSGLVNYCTGPANSVVTTITSDCSYTQN